MRKNAKGEKAMRGTGGKEFLGLLCNLYIIFLTAVLSLYTGGTYWKLGDTKYQLFRNVSLVCLGVWLAILLFLLVRSLVSGEKKPPRLSLTDFCMLAYALAVLVSALCCVYPHTPWFGYTEWYMGAISQFVFVGIYFLVSRSYSGSGYSVYIGEASFFIVLFIGLCNRLGWDPVGLMSPFNSGDWEYSHMISTIGNINWFCGYCSVMLSFTLAGYLRGKGRIKRVLLYGVSVLGLVLLCIQGSDAGPVIAAAGIGVSLLYGLRSREIFQRGLRLAGGMCLVMAAYGRLALLLGKEAVKAVPADGIGFDRISWNGWWPVGLALLLLSLLFGKLSERAARETGGVLLLLGGITVVFAAAWYALLLPAGDAWGSGRGGLWRLAWQGFLQGNLKQKLIGAGPDCFAAYIYSTLPAGELTPTEGFWAGTIYANAHNEWLNGLINLGLFGLLSLIGVFASSVKRYRGMPLGILALAMYGANSLISFQQVLSTPLLFMVLGLCENRVRKMEIDDEEAHRTTKENCNSRLCSGLRDSNPGNVDFSGK